jgi:hypothetical protein
MFAKVSTALLVVALSANQALASCPWYSSSCNSPPAGSSVPEIDGTAGIMALALVASVAGLLYNRTRKQ